MMPKKPNPRHHREHHQPNPVPDIRDPAARITALKTPPRQLKRDDGTQEVPMTEPTIALTVLVLELDATAAQLSKRLADEVLTDDLGRLAIDRDRTRELIAERHAAQQASRDRERERRAEAIRRGNPILDRVWAVQASQQRIDADGDLSKSAHAAMLQGDYEARTERSDQRMDEYLSGRDGVLTQHRHTPRKA
jgi:hypothetical protein